MLDLFPVTPRPPSRKSTPVLSAPPPSPPTLPKTSLENRIILRLKELLLERKGSNATDKQFRRLEELLTQVNETEKCQHCGLSDLLGDSEGTKSDDRFSRLERLLLEQQEDSLRLAAATEAKWNKERASAQSAKKSAEKALRFTKEQAAKRAQDEAERRAAEERKNIDEDYRRRIEIYEQKLVAFSQKPDEVDESDNYDMNPTPLRRTCISDGNRHIEVSEYSRDRMEPIISPEILTNSSYFSVSATRPITRQSLLRGSSLDGSSPFLSPWIRPGAQRLATEQSS
ncbi:hypothetical protein CC78DRAFT_573308 [Lojkania enalia]|uniref:Uncharacterized protein n=1 Tax=Lojkania enalia TaxID=147567 RepID=A0A9P4NCY4_9PLEO|nr:hypothetical protein CC78DRAFT_573308 [Didymosphaeria enalia]